MENKLKDALSKAKEADNAKAQVKDLIRDAEDDIGAYLLPNFKYLYVFMFHFCTFLQGPFLVM